MKRPTKKKKAGFWRDTEFGEGKLPWPEAIIQPWKGRHEFLEKLYKIQEFAEVEHFKGWSNCRICLCKNGSTEYHLTSRGVRYRWPGGLVHYVGRHNVKPSESFVRWVMRVDVQSLARKQSERRPTKEARKIIYR